MRAVSLVLVSIIVPGCGGTPTLAPTASVHQLPENPIVTLEPQLMVASTTDPTMLVIGWDVAVLAGPSTGGNVLSVNATVRDAASGVQAWPDGVTQLDAAKVAVLAGSAHLAPGTSLRVHQSLEGKLLSGMSRAIVTVAVHFSSDSGESLTQLAQAELAAS